MKSSHDDFERRIVIGGDDVGDGAGSSTTVRCDGIGIAGDFHAHCL
jgi:hypothetical protein